MSETVSQRFLRSSIQFWQTGPCRQPLHLHPDDLIAPEAPGPGSRSTTTHPSGNGNGPQDSKVLGWLVLLLSLYSFIGWIPPVDLGVRASCFLAGSLASWTWYRHMSDGYKTWVRISVLLSSILWGLIGAAGTLIAIRGY